MSAIQGIEGVISQLQATAMSARAQESLPQPTISFAGQLHAALDRISDTQTAARTQAEKFTLGEPGVALNDVMTDMQKASVSMQMGIQVRNKLVAAYQEVMSMQVCRFCNLLLIISDLTVWGMDGANSLNFWFKMDT